MEKLESKTYSIERVTHRFYCDDCNTYLGKSEEYDDGYYQDLGEFKLKMYLPSGWYIVEKCLCNECREKFLKKVENTLKELGFKKE